MTASPFPSDLLTLLGAFVLKSLAVFGLAGLALWGLRRASASGRHLVCLLTLAALLLLPLLSADLPGWTVPALTLPAAPLPAPSAVPAPLVSDTPAPAALPVPSPPIALVPTAVPPVPPRPFPWPTALLAVWLLGVLVACLRPGLGLWGIGRLRRDCRPVPDAPTLALAQDCANALGLKRLPTLWQADVPVPMTWGTRRPVILLPLTAESWPAGRLQSVLLHEQAHVRRGDWVWHRLADAVCALYWFHPFVWWTAHRLRAEGEMACDDLVLSSGVAAPDYARHLLDVARGLQASLVLPQAALAMARTLKIERRLTMMLDSTHNHGVLTRRARLTALAVALAALVPLATLRPAARAQAASDPAHGQVQSNAPVQLAGITGEAVPNGEWWSAGGQRVLMPSLQLRDWGIGGSTKVTTPPGQKGRFFAFRLPPAVQTATVIYEAPDETQGGLILSMNRQPARVTIRSLQTYTISPGLPLTRNPLVVFGASFPATLLRTRLRVGAASGPWLTAATVTCRFRGRQVFAHVSGNPSYSSHLWLPSGPTDISPFGSKITTFFAQASDLRDLRAVALDRQGHSSVLFTSGVSNQGGRSSIVAPVSRPLSQIREIRIEARPFAWTEFKDIALQPAPTPESGTEGTKP